MHFGVDVSSNNPHPINYKAVADRLRELGGGAQPFVIIKATQGTGYVNPDFSEDVAGFRAQGCAIGAYLMDEGTAGVAEEEAAFRRVAGGLPQFDDDELPMGNAAYAQHCADLLAQNPNAMDYLNQAEEAGGYPQGGGPDWEANYNKTPGRVRNPRARLHQYDDAGRINGAEGNWDLNAWLGTEDEFAQMFHLTAASAPSAPEEKETILFLVHQELVPDNCYAVFEGFGRVSGKLDAESVKNLMTKPGMVNIPMTAAGIEAMAASFEPPK